MNPFRLPLAIALVVFALAACAALLTGNDEDATDNLPKARQLLIAAAGHL